MDVQLVLCSEAEHKVTDHRLVVFPYEEIGGGLGSAYDELRKSSHWHGRDTNRECSSLPPTHSPPLPAVARHY